MYISLSEGGKRFSYKKKEKGEKDVRYIKSFRERAVLPWLNQYIYRHFNYELRASPSNEMPNAPLKIGWILLSGRVPAL